VKRLNDFINSDEPDGNVVFVKERAQIRPATTKEKSNLIETVAV